MTTIITFISNSTLLKWLFGYSFTLSSLSFVEQEFTNQDFFTGILNQMPSKLAMGLGIIYGVVIVLGKISKEWKQHKLNLQDVKKDRELLEQEELRTEKQRKEL